MMSCWRKNASRLTFDFRVKFEKERPESQLDEVRYVLQALKLERTDTTATAPVHTTVIDNVPVAGINCLSYQ